MTGLCSHFRACDRSGDGMLDRFELRQALNDYHINLADEVNNFVAGLHRFPPTLV